MDQVKAKPWPNSEAIVDQRSGLTTILMMVTSVEGVILAATLANHHWHWAIGQFVVFALIDAWLSWKAYGLGIGVRDTELGQHQEWSASLREAVAKRLQQVRQSTDRDWLTRAELRSLRRSPA